MQIHLPNSAFLGNIDPFLRSFDPQNPQELRITANKKWISIHPLVLAMTAAAGLEAKPDQRHCQELTAKSKHYLDRMKLFDLLDMPSKMEVTEHESAGRFIPLTQIKNSEDLSWFVTEMVPLLHLEPRHAQTIRYVVSELIRNVLEHARSPHGAIVAAQYYAKSNTIRIGIADRGVGVKKSISQSHAVTTDMDAVQLALTPGITGTTAREGGTDINAGAGLFFIKSIATVNKDFFVMYSGSSLYKLLKSSSQRIRLFADPFKDRHSKDDSLPYWQGTAVGIDINLDSSREFSELLDAIHDTYIEAIKERKKKKYRRPRFE